MSRFDQRRDISERRVKIYWRSRTRSFSPPLGLPRLTLDFNAESTAAGSVACSFLYTLISVTCLSCR